MDSCSVQSVAPQPRPHPQEFFIMPAGQRIARPAAGQYVRRVARGRQRSCIRLTKATFCCLLILRFHLVAKFAKRSQNIQILQWASAQRERTRRIGVLMNLAADDPDGPPRITAFAQGLQENGWAVGRNVRIDYRWSVDSIERGRMAAAQRESGSSAFAVSSASSPPVAWQSS